MIRGERGITVIEVMVAGLILVVGSLGLLTLIDTTARSTYRAEQSQVVSDRLQREMEAIKQLPYEEIALTGLPADSSDPAQPSWRVSGTSFATAKDGSAAQPLVYNGSSRHEGGTVEAGAVSSAPEPFHSGDVGGTIHRFVTWEDVPSCPEAKCPGAQDAKRIIVAILLDETASGGARAYQELQAQVTDPEAEPVDDENPVDPNPGGPKPWTFWLTDTTCDHSTRQPITSDHLTHNTRGTCGAELKTGNNPGAPDLTFTEAPPLEDEQPIYDYATDVEPTVNPHLDKGLQLVREASDGCLGSVLDILNVGDLLEPDRFQKVHKWLSKPIPNGFDIQLDGQGTLSLWTQTINGAVHPGRLCVWLFVRQTDLGGIPVDTPAVNLTPPLLNLTYFQYELPQWPREWTEVQIPLSFALNAHLLPGTRLGVAFTVERSGTPGQGLQFMYDTPSFDSRLEVKSTSLLPEL